MRTVRPALLSLAVALGGIACGPLEAPEPDKNTPQSPDDHIALRLAFEKVADAAKGGDPAAVVRALEPFLATRDELVTLFGPEAGARAWKGYSDTIAATLRAEAGEVIVRQVKDGLTEVAVELVGPEFPARTTPGDQRLLDAMRAKRPMYSVRLRRPGELLGLRLNGFVYIDGKWRALLKTYDHLDPPPDAEPPPPPPTDAGAPASDAGG